MRIVKTKLQRFGEAPVYILIVGYCGWGIVVNVDHGHTAGVVISECSRSFTQQFKGGRDEVGPVTAESVECQTDPVHGLGGVAWLRLVRLLTLYIVPGLIVIALAAEVIDAAVGSSSTSSKPYNAVLLSIFSGLSITMMALCGWVVFLWDIDRLLFKLEGKIDAELGEAAPTEQSNSLVGRTRGALRFAASGPSRSP
jgi:hypothetical protein